MINNKDIQIIKLMSEGLTMKQIADRMDMPACTLDTYRFRLYKKINVLNAPHCVAWGFRNKVLQ